MNIFVEFLKINKQKRRKNTTNSLAIIFVIIQQKSFENIDTYNKHEFDMRTRATLIRLRKEKNEK